MFHIICISAIIAYREKNVILFSILQIIKPISFILKYTQKKIISITLCAALALSAAACGNNNFEAVQIPSPFVDCDTMDAAKELANKDMVKVIPLFASGFDPYLQLQLLMPDKLFCLL